MPRGRVRRRRCEASKRIRPRAQRRQLSLERLEPRLFLDALALADPDDPLGIAFQPNLGQAAAEVAFLSEGTDYTLFLTPGGAAIRSTVGPGEAGAVRMDPVGASDAPSVSGVERLPGVTNYVVGTDPSEWITGVPSYAQVSYSDVWEGIDLVYYGRDGAIEYDWIVAPGADPDVISVQFSGVTGLEIEADGDLLLRTSAGDLTHDAPQLHQEIDGVRQAVAGRYVLEGDGRVGFEIGAYDPSRPLVIDPVLGYSTYLGGSHDEAARDVATDAQGNIYVVGNTASDDFPGHPTQLGTLDKAFLTKFDPQGRFQYTTLFGTFLNQELHQISSSAGQVAVRPDGVVYATYSTLDLRFQQVTPDGPRLPLGDDTALHLVALNPDTGIPIFDRVLLTGRVLNNQVDPAEVIPPNALVVDDSGAAYIAGVVNRFPGSLTLEPYLIKVAPTGEVVFQRQPLVIPTAIAVDDRHHIYLATTTSTAGLPTTPGAFQPQLNPTLGNPDVYVAELDPSGSGLVAATYLGGEHYEALGGLAVDPDQHGVVYLAGVTASRKFPIANALQPEHAGALEDGWITILDLGSGDPTGFPLPMTLIASTYFGGSGTDLLSDVALDLAGNVYVVGETSSQDLRLANPLRASWTRGDQFSPYDFVIASFAPGLSALRFSTYFGGSGMDNSSFWSNSLNPQLRVGPGAGPRLAVMADGGTIHLAGGTSSSDFPVKNASQPAFRGGVGGLGREPSDAVVLSIEKRGVLQGFAGRATQGEPFTGVVADFAGRRDALVSDFQVTIHWADGTQSGGLVTHAGSPGNFAVLGSHVYAQPGSYPVLVEVTDVKGISPVTAVNISNLAGTQFEPSIAVDPRNAQRLFASAVDEQSLVRLAAGAGGGLFAAVSSDGGVTWDPRRMADGGDDLPLARGDPKAVFDEWGNLFLTYLGADGNTIVLVVSKDGGKTFRRVGELTAGGTPPAGQLGVDQPSVAVGANTVWVTFQDKGGQVLIAAGAPVFGRDLVGDLTAFTVPEAANGGFGDISIGPNGEVVVLWQSDINTVPPPFQVLTSIDPDNLGPLPFSAPRPVTTTSTSSTAFPFMPRQPIDSEFNFAWDLKRGPMGRLYVAYTDPNPADPSGRDLDVWLRHSDDAGASWSTATRVIDEVGGGKQFLPSVAVDQNPRNTGDVAVGWYDTRADVDDIRAQFFVAVSGDGGRTFSRNIPTNLRTSNAALMDGTVGRPKGYGDYSTLSFVGGVLHPIWSDNHPAVAGVPGPISFDLPDPPQLEVATAVLGVIKVAAAPVTIRPTPIQAVVNQPFSDRVATFTHPDASRQTGEFTATIVWGDGWQSAGTITQPGGGGSPFVVSGSHTYDRAGAFPLSLTVRDNVSQLDSKPVSNVSSLSGSQNEGGISIDPTNPQHVFAVSNDPAGVTVSFSEDAGVTWHARSVGAGNDVFPPTLRGDPSVSFDQFGNLFFALLQGTTLTPTVLLALGNNGATVQVADLVGPDTDQPTVVTGPGTGGIGGSVWMTTDAYPTNDLVVVSAPVTGRGVFGPFSHTTLPIVDQTGAAASSAGGVQATIAVGPDGQVLALYHLFSFDPPAPTRVIVRLDPDGEGPGGFAAPVLATTTNVITADSIPPLASAAENHRAHPDAELAWDRSTGPNRGRVYLVYADSPALGNPDHDIFLRYSDDNGAKWSDRVAVNAGVTRGVQFFPSVAVDPISGNVAVGWHSTESDPQNVKVQFNVALSGDGGLTFSPSLPVSVGLSDATAVGLDPAGMNNPFGDYTNIAFRDGIFYPIWGDNSLELPRNPDPPNFEMATARVAVAEVSRRLLVVSGVTVAAVEGNPFTARVASFTDPDGPQPASRYRATIDWGDGNAPSAGTIRAEQDGSFSVLGQHEYRTFGRYTAKVELRGPRTHGAVETLADIADAPRDLQFAGEGQLRVVRERPFTEVIAFLTDLNHNSRPADYDATIEWGDGAFSDGVIELVTGGGPGEANVFSITGTHEYLAEQTFDASVRVRDRATGNVVTADGQIVSGDPQLLLQDAFDFTALQGISTGDLILAVFGVDGPIDTAFGAYTATINWGDGEVDTNVAPFVTSDEITVVGRHIYETPGQYFPSVTLVDDSGGSALAPLVAAVEPDVTHLVRVVGSGLVYNPASERFHGELSIANQSGSEISGPFYVLLQGLPQEVTLESFDQINGIGDLAYEIDQSVFFPGSTLPPVPLVFRNPDRVSIHYSVKVFDGIALEPPGGVGLVFEPNRGQADPSVAFLALGPTYAIGLAPDHAALVLRGAAGGAGTAALMEWVGGDPTPTAVPLDPQPGVSHYLRADQQLSGVPHYGRIRYTSVYSGIDLEYYGREGLLEYDWIVRPGADAAEIAMHFRGVDDMLLDGAGNLRLRLGEAELVNRAPVAYQLVGGERQDVSASYELRADGSVGFSVTGHDPTLPLVIDPVLVYSTYLGGENVDVANAVAIDADGYSWVSGRTLSPNFPTAAALDDELNTPGVSSSFTTYDAFVTKLDPQGELVFSTFLGGGSPVNAFGTTGWAIAIDPGGGVWVGGSTDSPLFPAPDPAPLDLGIGPDPNAGAFLTRLTPDGSALVYSTLFRGPHSIFDLAVDAGGVVHAVGNTSGSVIAFAIDPGGAATPWRTALGGGVGRGIAMDAAGQSYVTGFTNSPFFLTVNALFPEFRTTDPGQNSGDGFVAKLSATGEVLFSTYLGGAGVDAALDLGIGPSGVIHVVGQTDSTDLPVPGGLDTSLGGPEDGFLITLANDGSSVLYGTYVGGGGRDVLNAVGVDALGRTHVAGRTSSADLPVVRAHQPQYGGGPFGDDDGLAGAIEADGSGFAYLTYLGGTASDEVRALAVDAAGAATLIGVTSSTDLPLREAWQPGLRGLEDGFIVRLLADGAGEIRLRNIPAQAIEGNEFDGLVAVFTTNGTESADQFSATIDWGDGTTSPGTISGNARDGFQVLGRHLYPDVGAHDVSVQLLDSLGRPVTATATDPAEGEVAGRIHYRIALDTAALAGTAGVLALQFNPGALPGAPEATAEISNLRVIGGSLVSTSSDGDATGDPRDRLLLRATTPLNRLSANVSLGTRIEFELALAGPALADPQGGGFGDVLAVQLFAADGETPLLDADAAGSLLRVDLTPDGDTRARSFAPGALPAALGRASVGNALLDAALIPLSMQEGQAFSGPVARFTNANPLELAGDFQALIDWADGSVATPGTIAREGDHFIVTGTHTYARAGRYPFRVSVVEPDGASVSAESSLEAAPLEATHAVEGQATLLIAGDFDGDGYLDAVVPGARQISVSPGSADLQFAPARTTPVATQFISTALAAQIDGDGVLDLVVAGTPSGPLEVLLGNGDGSFRPGPLDPVLQGAPLSLAAGDFDADGVTDLAVGYGFGPSGGTNRMNTFRGLGNGSFEAPRTHTVSFGNTQLSVADLDGDGRDDIVAANSGATSVGVLLAQPGGSFGAFTPVALDGPFTSFGIADLDGDDVPDLVIGGADVALLAGRGDGSFAAPVHHATDVSVQLIASGDLDGDGRVELAIGEGTGREGRVTLLRATDDGGFASTESLALPRPRALGLADWNGDGDLDLAVATSDDSGLGAIRVHSGRGDGTLRATRWVTSAPQQRTAEVLDVDGDGFMDLVTGFAAGVAVTLGDGSSVFDAPLLLPSGSNQRSVAVADLDGDGRADLIGTSSGGISVRLQNADGTYATAASYALTGGALDVAAGDLDGDGDPDLVASTPGANAVAVLRNDGSGRFALAGSVAAGVQPSSLLLRDLDGDGRLDLAVNVSGTFDAVSRTFRDAGIAVALGAGNASFGAPTIVPAGSTSVTLTAGAIAAGDVDGDAVLDLVMIANGSSLTQRGLFVVLGNGDGTFRPGASYLGSLPSSGFLVAVALGDFDRDGRLDVAVTKNSGVVGEDVYLLRGLGDGSFAAAEPLRASGTPGEIHAGDLDGDGALDLVIGDQQVQTTFSRLTVLLGQGDGSFAAPARYFGGNPLGLALADLDGDGALDVATADFEGSGLGQVSGRGDGTLRAPLLSPGGRVRTLTPADVDGDGVLDLGVAYETDEVGILMGRGDGSFEPRTPVRIPIPPGTFYTASAPWHIAVIDANADGQLEIVAGLALAGSIVTVPVQPDGSVGAPVFRSDPVNNSVFAFGDFDHDGRLDVARVSHPLSTRDASAQVLRAGADLSFTPGPSYATGNSPRDVLAADLDGDGHLDLAVANASTDIPAGPDHGGLTILLGIGDGTFHEPQRYARGVPIGPLALLDVEGDGDPDLVGLDGALGSQLTAGGIVLLTNRGDGSFDEPSFHDGSSLEVLTDIATGDLAADGLADIVLANANDRSLRIIANAPLPGGVTVSNAPLSVSGGVLNPVTGVPFSAVVAALSDANPLAAAGDFTANIDWGDGAVSSGSVSADGRGGFAIAGSHTYATPGVRPVRVSVSDDRGGRATGTGTADVSDVDLPLSGTSVPVEALVGVPFSAVVATFSDADPNGAVADFSANIDWGDGTTSSGSIAATDGGGFQVSGSHTYGADGSFSIQVEIRDIGGSFASVGTTAAVSSGVNRAPVAVDDTALTEEGAPVTISVLANDSDPDGDPLSPLLVTNPAHGSVTLQVDGSFVYTPAPDFAGSDGFSYRASDGLATSGPATVSIVVEGVNDVPVVSLGPDASLDEGAAFSRIASFEDPDADDTWTATVDYGDGSGARPLSLTGQTFTLDHVYADDGTYSPSVVVTDASGQSGSDLLEVTVLNVDPAVDAGPDLVASEGSPIAVSASFSDAGLLDTHTALIDWGDGTLEAGVVDPLDRTVSGTHSYAADGIYSVLVTVTDDDGGAASDGLAITVDPVAPPALTELAVTSRITEGGTVTLTGAFSSADLASSHTLSVDWGADVPEQVELAPGERSFTLTHRYLDDDPTGTPEDTYRIGVRVRDGAGTEATGEVSSVVANAAPEAAIAAPPRTLRGLPVPLTASFTDPGVLDTHEVAWDFGDGTSIAFHAATDPAALTPAHAFAAAGTYVVTLAVRDDDGGLGTASATLVIDAPSEIPVVSLGLDATVDEGTTFSRTAGFEDPDDGDTWTATVDYGDGSGVQALSLAGQTFTLDHVYADEGAYSLSVVVTDGSGQSGSDVLEVTVQNTAPAVDAGPDLVATEGSPVAVSASFSDAGLLDTHTALIDWGDGTLDAGVVDPLGKTVSGTHSYAADGIYSVLVTVADGDGGAASDGLTVTVTGATAPVLTALAVTPAISEGGTVSLTGSFSDTGLATTHTLIVDWATGVPEQVDLAPGARSFTLTHRYLDDDPTGTPQDAYRIRVRVQGDGGGEATGEVTTVVANAAPEATIVAPAHALRGVAVSFTGSFADPGSLDTHEVAWDFGDGTSIGFHPATDPGALGPQHGFSSAGAYLVTLTVRDDDGGVGTASAALVIEAETGAVALLPDPCDPTLLALFVTGTSGDDRIRILPAGPKHGGPKYGGGQPDKSVEVWINGVRQGTFAHTGRIIAHGLAGDDDIEIAGALRHEVELHGGPGNDRLKAGAGAALLLGGEGSDVLIGGSGADVLIGGTGKDRLLGGPGEDLLIGASTLYDADVQALCSIVHAWTDDACYDDRVARLTNGVDGIRLDASTLRDDGVEDRLTGSSGRDWFFAALKGWGRDKLTDRHHGEQLSALTPNPRKPPAWQPGGPGHGNGHDPLGKSGGEYAWLRSLSVDLRAASPIPEMRIVLRD